MNVIAIVGPTASGKSALALRAAERAGGEIVSADSRQVYRGMDIGTAKPSLAAQRAVRHHCIDLVDPGELYDAARYQRDARAALADIASRGLTAYLVGGTGLYVRALLDGLALDAAPTDPALRAMLEARAELEGGPALHRELARIDPAAAERVDPRNVRRVVRYLEVALLAGRVPAERDAKIDCPRIGLDPPRAWLDARIGARVRRMVDDGVLAETRRLVERGLDPGLPSMSGHGYVHWAAHLRDELTLEAAIAATAKDVRAYSRRQLTWFRRDPDVRWIDPTAADPLALIDAVAA
ncbi:MAG TPA: tRNA (adenosine(37)-N6)-dimethylallyltransferase MiaA [Chloroflexi bacterium]|jgi:tRNA dimethylallyltransferase|nr:tRNA (adenosine(37)-N6)-dimethylallyltransferase MiaA [Chloroflexota bacterium]HAL25454.1 tRNA (adenosine(37)-N6)-dimethylallyltransferase MiaA [Chloroflexota bacterium]